MFSVWLLQVILSTSLVHTAACLCRQVVIEAFLFKTRSQLILFTPHKFKNISEAHGARPTAFTCLKVSHKDGRVVLLVIEFQASRGCTILQLLKGFEIFLKTELSQWKEVMCCEKKSSAANCVSADGWVIGKHHAHNSSPQFISKSLNLN